MNPFDELRAFLAQPFSSSMSAGKWVLFVGLMLIAVLFWHMVIRALTNAE